MPPVPATSRAAPTGLALCLGRLALGDDPAAWSWLVTNLGEPMRVTAYRLTGDASLADDAVQEALLLLRGCASAFAPRTDATDGPDDQARRWILRVVANASRMVRRREQRAARRGRDIAAPAPVEAVMELERSESAQAIRDALDALPERERSAILLHVIADLGYDQVARELRCPIGSAKTWVHRGLSRLRQRLRLAPDTVFSLSPLLAPIPAITATPLALPVAGKAASTALLPASLHGASMATVAFAIPAVAALVLGGAVAYHALAADTGPAPAPAQPPATAADNAPGPPGLASITSALDRVMTMDCADTSLAEAAHFITKICGIPCTIDPACKSRPITIQMHHAPLRYVAELIAAQSGTALTLVGGLHFQPADAPTLKQALDRTVDIDGHQRSWPELVDLLRHEGVPIIDCAPEATVNSRSSWHADGKPSLRQVLDIMTRSAGMTWVEAHGWAVIGSGPLSRPVKAAAAALQQALATPVTFDFNESTLAEAMTFLSKASGADIVLDSNTNGVPPLTFKASGMRLADAMKWIAGLTNLQYATRAGAIVVAGRPSDLLPVAAPTGITDHAAESAAHEHKNF
jgi:RNA polymerase sigma factor (sigma-70 family)